MTTSNTTTNSASPFLKFVRGALGMGMIFAVAVGVLVFVLKLLLVGGGVSEKMTETVVQGFPFLGFVFGVAVASVRALYVRTNSSTYRAAVGLAVAAAFMLFWSILAVGALGAEGDTADAMYIAVFAVLIIGSLIARFQPQGMARALFATALAQTAVVAVALLIGVFESANSSVARIVVYNAIFIALFSTSALLFRRAMSCPQFAEVLPEQE